MLFLYHCGGTVMIFCVSVSCSDFEKVSALVRDPNPEPDPDRTVPGTYLAVIKNSTKSCLFKKFVISFFDF
jgi:hypothetical protein